MKYILIFITLVFLQSCRGDAICSQESYITSIEENGTRCMYHTTGNCKYIDVDFLYDGKFIDSCGKFNVGDFVIISKK